MFLVEAALRLGSIGGRGGAEPPAVVCVGRSIVVIRLVDETSVGSEISDLLTLRLRGAGARGWNPSKELAGSDV
jgi:hypothetical protein